MGKPIVVSVVGDTRDLVKRLGEGENRLGKFGRVARTGGLAVAAGVGAAAAGIVAFGGSAIKAASDAQQSLGATETVFGQFAGSVVKNSNAAARAVGLSADEYRNNANLIGSLFKNQGVASDQLAGKTDKMIKAGADLAATFGGPTSDAVAALGSAFKGEFDPLERYGISIKQSSINAELAARGQDKLTGAALTAAKQQATTRLIMAQAGDSLGAFGRESGTLANQQQKLGAQWDNLKAKAGSGLLPILTKLGTFANDTLLPAIEGMIPPVRDLATRIGQQLAPTFDKVGAIVRDLAPKFISTAQSIGQQMLPILANLGTFLTTTVIPAVVNIGQTIATNLKPVLDAVVTLVRDQLIPTFIRIQPTLQKVAGVGLRVAGTFIKVSTAITGRVLPIVIRLVGFLITRVVPAAASVVGAVAGVINKLITFGTTVFNAGKKAADFAGKVVRTIGGLPGKLAGALTTLVSVGSDLIAGLVKGIRDKAGDVINTIKETITDKLPGFIKKALGIKSPSRVFAGFGRNIVAGLVVGIEDEAPKLDRTMARLSDGLTTFSATPGSRTVLGPVASSVGAHGGITFNVTLNVPVGASGADIGREFVGYVNDYYAAGGTQVIRR